MRIKEITLKNFGKYKDVEKPLVFKEGVNVVYGLNEAGKSTLFNGLLTLLYGFKPANREGHPYLGWGENRLELMGAFEDETGTFQIERKLMSSANGRLLRGEHEEKIGNKPIDQLQNISRQTYESIYALSLQDVVRMGDKPWSEVEDRLILNYGMEDVLSPREVLEQLDEEMKKLFNPRGQAKNTRVKILETQIKDLKKERDLILENQEVVIEKEALIASLQAELDALLHEESELNKALDWWDKHEKVIELLNQLEGIEVRKQAYLETLEQIPDGMDQYGDTGQRLEKMAGQLAALTSEKEKIDQTQTPLSEAERSCLTSEGVLRALLGQWRQFKLDSAGYENLRMRAEGKLEQLTRHLSDLLPILSADHIVAVSEINLMTLEGRIENIDRLKKEIEALKGELYTKEVHPKKSSPMIAIGIMVLAALIFAGGMYLNQDILKYAAAIIFSYGGFRIMTGNQAGQEDAKVYQEKIDFNEKRIAEEVAVIQTTLSALDIDETMILEGGQRLLGLLKQGKNLAQEYRADQSKFDEALARATAEESRLHAQFEALGMVGSGENIDDALIERILESALKKNYHNEQLKTESQGKQARIDEIKGQYDELQATYKQWQAYLLRIGEGQTDTGMAKLKQFKRLLDSEVVMKGELDEKDPGHVLRQAVQAADDSQEVMGEKKIQLRELKDDIQGKRLALQEATLEREHLLKGVDLFDVESQISAFEEELEETKITYDQLLALRSVVAAYDQSYREEHQPDIHKRTGRYFSQITKGKYERVYNDEWVGKTALMIRQEDEDREADLSLSQGTRDQLYLALRLALADELDKDQMALPLFLDELFVNWDMPRLEEGLALIKNLSSERQVVVFTCHDWFRDKLLTHCDAHIIPLEG